MKFLKIPWNFAKISTHKFPDLITKLEIKWCLKILSKIFSLIIFNWTLYNPDYKYFFNEIFLYISITMKIDIFWTSVALIGIYGNAVVTMLRNDEKDLPHGKFVKCDVILQLSKSIFAMLLVHWSIIKTIFDVQLVFGMCTTVNQ